MRFSSKQIAIVASFVGRIVMLVVTLIDVQRSVHCHGGHRPEDRGEEPGVGRDEILKSSS